VERLRLNFAPINGAFFLLLLIMWYAISILMINAQVMFSVYSLPHYTPEQCAETLTLTADFYADEWMTGSCVYIEDSEDV